MTINLRAPSGRRLAFVAIALACSLALLVVVSVSADNEVVLIASGSGLALVALGLLARLALARRRKVRPAGQVDIGFVASRLLGLEKRVALLAAERERPSFSVPDEAAADLGLLGALVKTLADALGQQEREIADLRGRVDRLSRQALSPRLPSAERPPAEFGTSLESPLVRHIPSLIPTPRADLERAESGVRATDGRRIGDALHADSLELYLQPIVSLPQRHIRGYEILSRLRLADGSTLLPSEFVPALERLGMSGRLDEKVIARALVLATPLGPDLTFACNLSPASLSDGKFLAFLGRLAAENPVGARRLVLELPQATWRQLPAGCAAVFDRLRAVGVAFSMDRVTQLSFEGLSLGAGGIAIVKIPGALLAGGSETGPSAHALRGLFEGDVRVVAERVENERHIPDLIDLDIPLAQGFAFGRPRPVRADGGAGIGPAGANLQPETGGEDPSRTALGAGIAREGRSERGEPENEAGAGPMPLRAFLRRAG